VESKTVVDIGKDPEMLLLSVHILYVRT